MAATTPSYQLLATFVAVADAASFSKAARKLGVTKGTVSRAIARLEATMEVELLHRTTHQVGLSTAGAALYERAAPHLFALAASIGKLPERGAQPSGLLRLTAPNDLGTTLLPKLLSAFALRYPEVRLETHLTSKRVDLVAEGFDVAIRAGAKLADSSLTVRKLGNGVLRFYASPSYLARRGEPRELGDPRHDWAMFPTVMKALALPKGFRPRFHTDDFLMQRDLLAEGAGVGPLPTYLAQPYVAQGTLRGVLPNSRLGSTTGGVFLVYPSSGQVSRKLVAFRDFCVEHVRAHPLWT